MKLRRISRAVRPLIARLFGVNGTEHSAFQMLESRQLLAGGPLPTLADLESPNNTVVRLETNFGDIDFELFNADAPVTVANFLTYVNSGRLDNTFFHRSAFTDSTPFVLQGGGFSIDDTAGITAVSTDPPIVKETTGRSNLQRTVAMARTSDLNSATSQFFINYNDNNFLDTSGGGYAVFARVIGGWNVVLNIQNLRSLSLTGVAPFQGSQHQSIGGEVPVHANYVQSTALTEANAVVLINAEVIKPAGIAGFFNQRLVMPEGFRSGATTENLELVNPNSVAAGYQIIARYETGIRDTVIASGTLSANTSLEIKLSDALNTALNTVRSGVPYALVVETALPSSATNIQPIAASINRLDFGSATGEPLFNATGYSDSDLRSWLFPRVERATTSREFMTWVNLSDQTATVTVEFLTTGGTVSVSRTLEAYRRGGLEVFSLNLPTGMMSARVTSTQNIVTFLSDWDLPLQLTTASSYFTPAFGTMGAPAGGATEGVLPDAVAEATNTNTLSIYNPGSTVAVVTLSFWRASRLPSEDPSTVTRIIFAGGREDYALSSGALGIPAGERFSVSYASGSANIGVQWTSVDDTSRGLPVGQIRTDGISTLLATRVAPIAHFGDGNFDVNRTDGSMVERISLFNPFADSNSTYAYTVTYTFSDGTAIDAFTGSLSTNQRVDLLTGDSTPVRNKIGSNAAFRHYSVTVRGTGTQGSTTTSAVLAQFTRTDTTQGRSVSSLGSVSGFGLSVGDSTFDPDT